MLDKKEQASIHSRDLLIKKYSKLIKNLLPLFIVILLAAAIFPVAGAPVSNSSARYLQSASSLFENQSDKFSTSRSMVTRRPLYPLILAVGFKLGGKSVHSASLITRLFFALEIILVYLIGQIFYGKIVGLLSSLLMASSYGITIAARHIDTDIVVPFFVLLFILFYYLSLSQIRMKTLWAILSGFSLTLALVTKETSIVFLGLLLAMFFLSPKGKRWDYGKQSLTALGTLVLIFFSLLLYLALTSDSFLASLKTAYNGATYRMLPFGDWLYFFTAGFPKTITKFYTNFLQEVSPAAFLMVGAWIFALLRGLFKKNKSDLILSISILCFLPIMLQLADEGDRLGQTTTVYMLFYILLASFVVSASLFIANHSETLYKKIKKSRLVQSKADQLKKIIGSSLIFIVLFFLVQAQLFNKTNSTWYEWKDGSYALRIFNDKKFVVYGRYISEQKEAAEWLKKNSPKNAKIVADGYSTEALDFFHVAGYKIPEFHPVVYVHMEALNQIQKREDNLKPLFLLTNSKFDSETIRQRNVYLIFENDIVSALNKENADYLVISTRGLFLKTYFDKAAWADLKLSNRKVSVYEINLERFKPVVFEHIGVNDSINEHLDWLRINFPDEYTLFIEKIEILGFSLDDLKESKLRFPVEHVY